MSPSISISTDEKIVSLNKLVKILRLKKRAKKKIGLITGGFDIIHKGHISLFRFAKDNTDIVVVGVEQDKTISLSKGQNRPVNRLIDRCEFLSELRSVDYVFAIPFVFRYGEPEKIDKLYAEIYKNIQPDCLITNITADKYWEQKKKRAQDMKIGFLGQETPKDTSSTSIASKIQEEI